MPTMITIGLSKKVGLPDYGSLGATCSVQFEADHGLLESDLDGFHRRVRNAYAACRQAVQDELAREQQVANSPTPAVQTASTNGNGQHNGNGQRRPNGRKATASQVRAIHAIINRQGLDLVPTLRDRFGVEFTEDLAISEASQLIDDLKAQANGAGGRG